MKQQSISMPNLQGWVRRLLLGAIVGLASLNGLSVQARSPSSPNARTYVLFDLGKESISMSGSSRDAQRARSLRSGLEGLLYIREGATEYVIRDAEILRQAHAIVRPQELLGRQQAELGWRQAALGKRQAAIGNAQAAIGVEQARLAQGQAHTTPGGLAELRRRQEALAQRQSELSRQQDVLLREQTPLADRQARLREDQVRLARTAKGQFRDLLQRAVQRAAARRAD